MYTFQNTCNIVLKTKNIIAIWPYTEYEKFGLHSSYNIIINIIIILQYIIIIRFLRKGSFFYNGAVFWRKLASRNYFLRSMKLPQSKDSYTLWRTIMHCIMPFSKRSLSPSGLRRVGDRDGVGGGKKGAGGGECRERLLTPSSSHIHIHIYVSSCVLPLGTCAMRREWQSAGCSSWCARERERDLHSLFRVEHP